MKRRQIISRTTVNSVTDEADTFAELATSLLQENLENDPANLLGFFIFRVSF